jgi:hypothetical protein
MSDSGELSPRPRDPNNPLALVPPRFSVDPKARMKGVRQDLVEMVKAGAEWLPPGYRVVVTSGYRVPPPDAPTPNSRHYRGGALDVEIIDPNGNRLPDRGRFGGGEMYRRLAHGVYNEATQRNPELASQMAWGGEFETKKGSGVSDYMHFDFGGRRGLWPQQGWAMPAAPGTGPTTQLAAAAPAAPAPPMTSPLDVGDPSTWPQTWNVGPFGGGVSVQPLAQTAAAPATSTPPASMRRYAEPEDEVLASGLPVPRSPDAALPTPGPSYTGITETPSAAGESDAPVSGDPESLISGLTQPKRSIFLDEPFEARQPATSYQPSPDLASNLYSGGAVPGAMGREQQATNTELAGGPLSPAPKNTVGAGGPSGAGDSQWKMPEENAGMLLALMGAMMNGMKVTPINWDPFQKILNAGQASTDMPRSALATSPLGKLVGDARPITNRTGPIVPRPVDVAAGAAPRNIYEKMNLGLQQRRAGPETAS